MSTIATRLKEAREVLGISQAELAARAGVSAGTIGNIESGARERPRELLAIAAAACVLPQWLESGSGPRTPEHADREYAQAHALSDLRPIMAPPNLSWELLMDAPLPPYFLLTMQDDAIAQVVPKGRDYLFSTVEPTPPRSADVVLVVDAGGHTFCRIFEAGRGGTWRAVSTTTGYPPLDSEADQLTVIAIGMGPWGRRG